MKNVMKVALMVATVLVFVGATCGHLPPIPIEPTDTANCASACKHLQELDCEEGQPLEDGTSCTKFCEDTQKSGHALNPTCVMGIQTCEGINTCTGTP